MINRNILERLFRQYYCKMLHLARTLLHDDDDAEDVVQEVFARLSEKEFQVSDDKIESYLMLSVRYGCFHRIKAMQLRERVQDLYIIEDPLKVSAEEPLEEVELIRDYVNLHLTEPHKTIFLLRLDEGLKFREIAERLNMNINTVYKHFIQCLDQIKVQLFKK